MLWRKFIQEICLEEIRFLMNLFVPIKNLSETKLHEKFLRLRDDINLRKEKELLQSWTFGMVDKDHKMVRQFQESFHSCFWEFYLFAVFKEFGFVLDQSHQVPDFIIKAPSKFYVEAVVSNIRKTGKQESSRNICDVYDLLIPPYLYDKFYSDLDESITRSSNSLNIKLSKYKSEYSCKYRWIKNDLPFVIAICSFDQINYGREYIYSMFALLYGAYYVVSSNTYAHRDFIIKPGTKDSTIPLGVFVNNSTKDEYSDISAVIFSCSLTLGKLTSLTISDGKHSYYSVKLIRNNINENKYYLQNVSNNSLELLSDGLFVFHNPNAKNKLDENLFINSAVTQFYYENNEIKVQGNMCPIVVRHNIPSFLEEYDNLIVQYAVQQYNIFSLAEYR